MSATVCLTIDVEDWYDGMRHLGHPLPRPVGAATGLERLSALLAGEGAARVTLFVVGDYVATVRDQLSELARAGHEIASHGPDHGYLPDEPDALLDWLRRGRETLEDGLQVAVVGMRSPRFSFPEPIGLAQYRELLARAGYEYVSDRHRLGAPSPVDELPVLASRSLPVGGGSYQRVLPRSWVRRETVRSQLPAVHYYHSYDFGAPLPTVRATRSAAVARQVLGRSRVEPVFQHLLSTYGSETCGNARNTL